MRRERRGTERGSGRSKRVNIVGKKREKVEREGKTIRITKWLLKREAGGRMRFLGKADFLLTNSGNAAGFVPR